MIRSGLVVVLLAVATAVAGEREPPPPEAKPEEEKKAEEQPAPVKRDEEKKPEAPKEEVKPPAPESTLDEKTVESYRTPFEVLSERMIGTTSRAVLYDWRKKTVSVGVVGSTLLELNNFSSARIGGFVRVPFGNLTAEFATTWVIAWAGDSAEKLALTPYRQAGRPNRVEFDLNLGYALVEGVGTPRFSFLPTAELVFQLNLGFRYLYYPNALGKANAGQVLEALFAPRLQDRELEYLERWRLPGMQLDVGRYSLLLGFELDLFFRTGIFIAPRVMLNLPVLASVTGSRLGWWWELSLSLGWMF